VPCPLTHKNLFRIVVQFPAGGCFVSNVLTHNLPSQGMACFKFPPEKLDATLRIEPAGQAVLASPTVVFHSSFPCFAVEKRLSVGSMATKIPESTQFKPCHSRKIGYV
jgi:hypothetical protein